MGVVALSVALLAREDLAGAGLVVAMVLLTASDLTRHRLVRVVAASAGVVAVAVTVDPAEGVPSGVLAGVALVGIAGTWPRLGTEVGRLTAVALLAIAAIGVYVTVPDTEEVLLVVPLVIPVMALLAWPLVAPTPLPAFALLGLLVWAAAQGGRGRPGAVIGAMVCLLLVAAPVASRQATHSVRGRAVLLAVHAGAVLVVTRVAGLETSAAVAALIAVPVAIAAVVVKAFLLRSMVASGHHERLD